jgi:uncharacterized protein involved in exopolysaccharide biosynthesis
VAAAPGAGSLENLASGTTGEQLDAARASLRLLQLRNTPDHPDVRIMARRIRDLEQKLKTEMASEAGAAAPEPAMSPADIQRQRRLRDLTAQIAAVDRQLSDYQAEDARLAAVTRDYEAKVNALPTRESELVELTRDYATLQSSYQSLLAKREESKIAANLERRNIGEQFRVLDPARVPERPFSPDRLMIALTGLAAGLGLGLAFLALMEYADSTFRTEEDIVRTLSLPVLAMVPVVWTNAERRVRRRRILAGGTAVVMAIGSAAAAAWWRLHS